ARFFVTPPAPSIATANESGFGAAGKPDGAAVMLRATGLGQTDPALASGAAAPADMVAAPRVAVRATVGGLTAESVAKHSADKPGEFEISIQVPAAAQNGDVVTVFAGNAAGNRVTFGTLSDPSVKFVRLPDGATNLRSLSASDLRGGFLALAGVRGADGCYPAYLIDTFNDKAEKVEPCLTAAQPQAPSPFSFANDGSALAALIGPPDGDAQSGVSAKVAVFQPGAEKREVELSGKAAALNPGPGGNIIAIIPGTPPRIDQINPLTGEVTSGGPGGGGQGGGGGINFATLQVDLGDGVKEVVTIPVGFGQGQQGVVVVDSLETVTKAKFAVVNQQLQPQFNHNFPDNWLPIMAPIQQGGGPGGPLPGGPPGGALANRFRVAFAADVQTRQYYVLARNKDKTRDAFIRFPLAADQQPQVLSFPEGTFASSCVPQIRIFNLELSRAISVATRSTPEDTVRNPCGATGFRTLDLTTRQLSDATLPGQGEISVTGNALNEVNDYIYGSNTDPARQGRADTIYVYDGVTDTAFRMDLPPEVATFANLNPFPPMGLLFGQGTSRVPGDAGIVVFDLENASTRLLPTPAGFASVQPLSIFPATRKLIARGTRAEPAGSQILIYDLVSGDLRIVANPEGVSWAGAVPAVQPQPGQPPNPAAQQPALQSANPKANSVSVVGFNAQRQPVGVLTIRVH
ncbi:MAG: hypothetical protein FJW30_28615, partial [Acidobacteria bacterium]|nr:hypothetical protein [Acidobacteriota bacterium]